MADYGKKTVAELKALLESRGVATTAKDKKADLIAKLGESDKSASAAAPAAVTDPTSTAETTAPAPPAPSTETHQPAQNGAMTETTAAPAKDFTSGVAASNLDDELERRKKRAERFGVQAVDEPEADKTEAQKTAERGKKFGTDGTSLGKLDEALSEDTRRGRKRGAEESSALDDPGLKRSHMRRGRGGPARAGRNGGGPGRPGGVQKPGVKDADRAAAEKRKQRFAGA